MAVLIHLQVAAQQREQETTQRAERQVTQMVIAMVMAFLICWLPYATFAMVVATTKDLSIQPALASLPSYFSKTATVYNPIIYVFMNKQFRSCLLNTMSCGHIPLAKPETTPAAIAARGGFAVTSERNGNKVAPT
uniref:Uncharacterized protein n=1 Tax=Sphaerodactylus townsendi TaxID=933632 RepID=A0ACB8ECM9_9SAUR